jgi:hypothetical protein
MTPTEAQIHALLEQKPGLVNFTPTYRWLIEAVELLLRHQLELREELGDQQRNDLCREVTKEVLAVLQDHLVIPVK